MRALLKMDAENDFLTRASSKDSLEESRVHFAFPPSVELGTSYGSYLHSRKSSNRKIRPKKPARVSMQPALHRDLELLSTSLSQLCIRLKTNGQSTGALEGVLVGLQQLRSTLLPTAPAASMGEIVLYFLLQVVQALISITPEMDRSFPLVKDKEESRALRRLYQTTEAGKIVALIGIYFLIFCKKNLQLQGNTVKN